MKKSMLKTSEENASLYQTPKILFLCSQQQKPHISYH